MAVYTVHGPARYYGNDVRTAPDQLVFVRDGFYVWAFVGTFLWLLWHRLWLALIGYLVVSAALEGALWAIGAGASTRMWAMAVVALFMGFEASSLRRWTLSRRKWRQLDIVVADDEESAERRFFHRWTERQGGVANNQWSVDRGAPPPTRSVPGQPFSKPPPLPQGGIIGLFPEPGGSR